MRLFFIVKVVQGLICFACIALIITVDRLCGKSSLDTLLSSPHSVCAKFLHSFALQISTTQQPFLRNSKCPAVKMSDLYHVSPVTEDDMIAANESKFFMNNESVMITDPTDPIEMLLNNANGTMMNFMSNLMNKSDPGNGPVVEGSSSVSVDERRSLFESLSCIEITPKDYTCFKWDESDRYTPCDAISFISVTPIILLIQLFFIAYTIGDVLGRITPPSKMKDMIFLGINMLLSMSAGSTLMVIMYWWDKWWSNIEFKPEAPTQWKISYALILILQSSFSVETYVFQWLYVRMKLVGPRDAIQNDDDS